jgi:hypothetical protein
MKNLFTYPSNSSTGYINPTYYAATANATQIESGGKYFIKTVGTTDFTALGAASNTVGLFFTANSTTPTGSGTVYIGTTGMVGKFLALTSGEYKAFPITYWGSTSNNERLEYCSKFINYWDDLKFGTNLSIFDFYSHPMTVFEKSPYSVTCTTASGAVDNSTRPIWQLTHASASHFSDNDQADIIPAISGTDGTTGPFYIGARSSTKTELFTTSGAPTVGATPYSSGLISSTGNSTVFVRRATGVRAIFGLNSGRTAGEDPFASYDSSTPARLAFNINPTASTTNPFNTTDVGGGSGSARTTSIVGGQSLYGQPMAITSNQGYNIHSMDLYTDTGKTTHPTMTEYYSGTLTKTFTNSTGSPVNTIMTNNIAVGSANAGSDGFSFTAGTESTIANLKQEIANKDSTVKFALARVTVSGGSATGSDGSSGVNMGTSENFDDLWFVNYDNDGGSGDDTITISKKVNDMTTVYNGIRTIAASGGTATVTIKIIDLAQTQDSAFMTSPILTYTGGIAKRIGGTVLAGKHFISAKRDILGPGNQSYQYKNTSNVTAYGARFSGTYYETADNGTPGTSASLTADQTPTFAINVDGNGRLTGYGTLGTINDKVGGVWIADADVVLPITGLADTYAPRTPSTVETDETFDTDDYWVDPAFPGSANQTNKAFPVDIPPARATVTYVQPSTTNITQSGRKFVRTSQFVRYKLQVEYAPMGVDDFRRIQKAVLAAQGQSQPFYFQLKYPNSNYVLFADGSSGTSTQMVNVTKLADRSSSQSIFTVGGFSQNETDALKDGEHIIIGGPNGNLAMVVSGQDANNFGEVKFRISHPTSSQQGFGQLFFKNPSHAVVTLASDEFEYFVDEQELYYVTVNFDLDEFK